MASGFILSVSQGLPGYHVLVTAGHVVGDYRKSKKKSSFGSRFHWVFDTWGPRNSQVDPIRFDIFESDPFFIDDTSAGLDFAFINLPPLVAVALCRTTVAFMPNEKGTFDRDADDTVIWPVAIQSRQRRTVSVTGGIIIGRFLADIQAKIELEVNRLALT